VTDLHIFFADRAQFYLAFPRIESFFRLRMRPRVACVRSMCKTSVGYLRVNNNNPHEDFVRHFSTCNFSVRA